MRLRRKGVTPELRRQVLERDKGCVAALLGFRHECRDQYGVPHAPTDLERLSMEHVHEGYGLMGRRAPDDLEHLVALCHRLNLQPPSKAMRLEFRLHLKRVNRRERNAVPAVPRGD